MKRILVLGERKSSLQRLIDLRASRPSWDGVAVSDARDAERALRNDRYDAVIAEIHSPADERLRILDQLNTDHPETARLVITNDRHTNERLQSASSTIGILPSDSSIDIVANVVERSIDVTELIRDQALKVLIERIEALPPAPTIYRRLNQALADDRSDASTVAAIIGEDPSLSGEILKVVNSALFGLRREITSISEAVSLLGFVMVRNLALSVSVYRSARKTDKRGALQIERLQQHALQTARIASSMASNRIFADECYLAGLLHDTGKLVFLMLQPDFNVEIQQEARRTGRTPHEVEQALGGGVTHAEAGAYLLHTWGMPYSIIEAAAFHHRPEGVSQNRFDTLAAVHVANRLAHDPNDTCDEYLASIGVTRNPESARIPA